MNTKLTLGLITAAALIAAGRMSYGDGDDGWGFKGTFERSSGVAPAVDPLYLEECGGCHMAYPPALLPGRSWEKIMGGLTDHFGDNAELDGGVRTQLTAYLVSNSADQVDYRYSRKITRSLAYGAAPLRIMDVPYIRHEHHEIPDRLVTHNPKVMSYSNCSACHQSAVQGSFSEREINIPDYGRWDD